MRAFLLFFNLFYSDVTLCSLGLFMLCVFILAYLFFCGLYSSVVTLFFFYILVVVLYHHLYCYNGCKVSIGHQNTVKNSSYATKGGDGLK